MTGGEKQRVGLKSVTGRGKESDRPYKERFPSKGGAASLCGKRRAGLMLDEGKVPGFNFTKRRRKRKKTWRRKKGQRHPSPKKRKTWSEGQERIFHVL